MCFFLKDQTTFLPLSSILMEEIEILKNQKNYFYVRKLNILFVRQFFCLPTTLSKNCHVLYCKIAQIGLFIFYICILLSLLLF
jgi:hypothetical protein